MERKLLALAIAGMTMSQAHGLTFTVTEENDNGLADTQGTLSYAIRQANDPNGSKGRANGSIGPDVIDFQSDINITGPMMALIDSDITIQGNGYTLSGGKLQRPLFIKSGNVVITDLVIEDGLAKGQNTYGGGAGAGLGGGLFIYDGDVTLEGVSFRGNRAFGGKARVTNWSGGLHFAGGGMVKTDPLADSSAEQFGTSDFGSSLFGDGGYGSRHDSSEHQAQGHYGGVPATENDPNGGFGAGGRSNEQGGTGGNGGFGSGGGYGYAYGSGICGGNDYICGQGGNGGFGGGGGYGGVTGGLGGFGAGGGGSYSSSASLGGFGTSLSRQDGAGMGGAIFIRSGQLALNDVTFEGNLAYGGNIHPDIVTGIPGPIDETPLVLAPRMASRAIIENVDARGYGGALFVLHTTENANGNHQGMPDTLPSVSLCGVTFSNEEGSLNYASATYGEENTSNVFDAGDRVENLNGTFGFNSATQTIAVDAGEDVTVLLNFTNCGADFINWSVSTNPTKGQAVLTSEGELTYTADEDASGSDTLVITASDGVVSKTLTVNVDLPGGSGGGSLFWLLGAFVPWLRRRK